MNEIIIDYTTSVFVPAGWRSIDITARAKRISRGMAEVVEVLEIDGETPRGSMSRTGANRQRFNGVGIAAREVGKRKRLSACVVHDNEDEQAAA
jgi:peptide deformylase